MYHDKVKDMIADKKRRLIVNINDLRRQNPKRAAMYSNVLIYQFIFSVSRLLNEAQPEVLAFQVKPVYHVVLNFCITYIESTEGIRTNSKSNIWQRKRRVLCRI